MNDKRTGWLFGDVRICKTCGAPMDRQGRLCAECLKQRRIQRQMEKNPRWEAR